MTWYEKKPGRLRVELELLRRCYGSAKVYLKNGRLTVLHKVVGERGEYLIKVVFDDTHPYVQPKAYAIKPDIRGTLHNHPRESNCLCLFRPENAGPHISGKMILDWAGGWIEAYEHYLEHDRWPEGNLP